MWILWSRCEASAWKNDKRKTKTITSGKTIWKGWGFLQTPILENDDELSDIWVDDLWTMTNSWFWCTDQSDPWGVLSCPFFSAELEILTLRLHCAWETLRRKFLQRKMWWFALQRGVSWRFAGCTYAYYSQRYWSQYPLIFIVKLYIKSDDDPQLLLCR